MKRYIKCFDIADTVVSEATEKYKDSLTLNLLNYDIFKSYCRAMDKVIDKNDVQTLGISVDEETFAIRFEFETDYIQVTDKRDVFNALIQRSLSFGFKQKNDSLVMGWFEFPSLWDYKKIC